MAAMALLRRKRLLPAIAAVAASALCRLQVAARGTTA